MKKITFLLLSIITSGILYSQSNMIEWEKNYGGSLNDGAYYIIQTADSGYVTCGYAYSDDLDVHDHNGANWYMDGYVVKLDVNGDTVWTRSLGGWYHDYANSVTETNDGGYILALVAGSDDGDLDTNYGSYDYWIVKLDIDGNIEWKKSYGGSSSDYANSVIQTTDGNYVVAGYGASSNGDFTGGYGNDDIWILKIDTVGNIIWKKNYGGSSSDQAYNIEQTYDGGFVVGGHTISNDIDVTTNNGMWDFWILKLDTAGNLDWQKNYGGSDWDKCFRITQTSDSGYVASGFSYSTDGDITVNNGNADKWIIKIDSAGALVWEKSMGGSALDVSYDIIQTQDGGYLSAGFAESNDSDLTINYGLRDYWIVKMDNNGNITWKESLGGDSTDYAFSVIQTFSGAYVVTGISKSFNIDIGANNGEADFWIAKLKCNPAVVPEICVVTVDSASGKNEIVWEKSNYPTYIESFNIYKEGIVAFVFDFLGNVPYNSLSTYLDTLSNPDVISNRYLITAVDSCGYESDSSAYHKTMHLTTNQGINDVVNLIWDNYEGLSFGSYVVYRNNGTSWDSLDAFPNNFFTYTDTDTAYINVSPILYYQVVVQLPSTCTADKTKNFNSAKSNTSSISTPNPLSLTTNSTNAIGTNCDGTASVAITGGVSPYTYSWNTTPPQTNDTATGLCAGDYSVLVTDANGDTLSASATVGTTPGILEQKLFGEVKLFPNPSRGIFTLEIDILTLDNLNIEIVNVLGQTIYTSIITETKTSVNLSQYPKGVYNLKVISNQGFIVRKIVIE